MNSRFLNLNWDQTMDQNTHFDAGLSSDTPVDSLAFHKLFAGLQNSGNCGEEALLQSQYIASSANSPPKLNLSLLGQLHQNYQSVPLAVLEQLAAGAGFSESAVRFSNFDGENFGQLARTVSREPISMSGVQIGMRPEMPGGESASTREERAMSDLASGSNAKKRKASQKCKGKELNSAVDISKVEQDEDSNAKRFRRDVEPENDIIEPKMEHNDGDGSTGNGGKKHLKESNAKLSEPPKDYIHVRARRGQATDSHSLAERVRREKISQRMKLLQDLVPGCNKVTGKAVMLDEIINYVQSLQRQVEFLSMKLATVNPRLDFNNLATLFQKDVPQPCGTVPNSVYPLVSSGMASSSYGNQPQEGSSLNCILDGMETHSFLNLLDATFQQNLNTHQTFCDGFGGSSSQLENFWADDLQNVVQMDIGPSQDIGPSHFPGSIPTAHRKTDL